MRKDFKEWHRRKVDLNDNKVRANFHEREVWFASLGTNIGFEQDGKGKEFIRPVIVLKKFNNEILWCLPLTKNRKAGKYYFSFTLRSDISTVILSQIRLIDSKRLRYRIGNMNPEDFKYVKEKLRQLLA